ncbi:MAG: hypothetical protein Q9210_005805 [Variospora velana]
MPYLDTELRKPCQSTEEETLARNREVHRRHSESLVLGNRGAAGLLRGTMSILGALSVIKACVAAATPGWPCETIGVWSKETGGALGIALTLDDRSLRSRRNAVGVCGVSCEILKDRSASSVCFIEADAAAQQDVYAFDQSVSGILELIPDEDTKDTFHILVPDVYYHEIAIRIFWKDWAAIFASTAGPSQPLKAPVRGLVQMLSLYQMHVHPRGFYCYGEVDRTIKDMYNARLLFPISAEHRADGALITVFISAILGDTLLSSASFIKGRKFAPLDKYDTYVVIIRTHEGDIAVPAARMMTDTPPPRDPDHVEKGFELLLVPRGGANRGKSDCTWSYWIPCEEDLWLELHTTDLRIRGERQAKVISGTTLTKHLSGGELYISISEVAHIEEIVSNSRLGLEAVQSLLR